MRFGHVYIWEYYINDEWNSQIAWNNSKHEWKSCMYDRVFGTTNIQIDDALHYKVTTLIYIFFLFWNKWGGGISIKQIFFVGHYLGS